MKKLNDMTIEELFFMREHGIIEAEAVNSEIMMRNKEQLQEKYHYWKTSKGIYKVHVYDGSKRKVVERKTEQGMIEYLLGREAGTKTGTANVTFKYCYDRWRKKQDACVDANTVQKYTSDYKRYFENSTLIKRNIGEITKDMLVDYMQEQVKHPTVRGKTSNRRLGRRAAKALWGYITNTFVWAEEHRYIAEGSNPCAGIDPRKTFYPLTEEIERPDDRVVIPPEQIAALNERFDLDHETQPGYIPVYALEFAALTGMRAGEIVALKWDDIHGDYIEVRRRESEDKLTGELRIKTIPKNKKSRSVPYTNAVRELLAKVRAVEEENGWLGEYIFTGWEGRITVHQLSSCMKNKCRQVGIRTKGIHAYRRTVNSLIRANGLSAEAAGSMLGNTPSVNTMYYTFDVTEDRKKQAVLENVNRFMLNPSQKTNPTNPTTLRT